MYEFAINHVMQASLSGSPLDILSAYRGMLFVAKKAPVGRKAFWDSIDVLRRFT